MRRNLLLRRIQKVRTGSYIISLPVEWIEQNGLKPHDSVIVVVDPNNNVVVRIPRSYCVVEIPVNGSTPVEVVRDIVRRVVTNGAYKVVLRSVDGKPLSPELVSAVRDLRRDLMGFEIEKISRDMLVAEVRDSIERVDVGTLEKYISTVMQLFREAVEDLCGCLRDGEAKRELLAQVRERMQEAKRTYRYARRLLLLSLREPERNGLAYIHQGIYAEVLSRVREISYYLTRLAEFAEAMERPAAVDLLAEECRTVASAMGVRDLAALYENRARVNALDERIVASGFTPLEAYFSFALRRIMYNLLAMVEEYTAMQLSAAVNCEAKEPQHNYL